jgi:transcriptional regulator
MYPPRHFEESRLPVRQELMQRHALAALIANAARGLEANHVALILDPRRGPFGTLRDHIARANTLWRDLSPGAEVLLIFQGAQRCNVPRW